MNKQTNKIRGKILIWNSRLSGKNYKVTWYMNARQLCFANIHV